MQISDRGRRVAPSALALALALVVAACGSPSRPETAESVGTSGPSRNAADLVKMEGDERVFAPPADLRSGEFVCETASGRYVVDATTPIPRDDKQMVEVGRCKDLGIPLYSPEGEAGAVGTSGSEPGAVRAYLKTGANSYLRLKSE